MIGNRLDTLAAQTARNYRIGQTLARAIAYLPLACAILSPLLIGLPATRAFFVWLVSENRPVELLTFGFFIIGGIIAVRLAVRCRQQDARAMTIVFYALYGIGLLVVAMEEIAWGQWFFGFETPEAMKALNAQGELTIHNLRGIQGGSEFYYLTFCMAATIGVMLARRDVFRPIAAPNILLPYVLVIALLALADLYCDYFPAPRGIAFAFGRISEVNELLISIAAFLYAWLNARSLARQPTRHPAG